MTNSVLKRCAVMLRVALLAALTLALARPAAADLAVGVGDVFPDFSALDQDNVTFTLSDFRGRVVLLHICAFWCSPCQLSARDEEAIIGVLDDAVGADSWVLIDALVQDLSGGPSSEFDARRWRIRTPARTLHGENTTASALSMLPQAIGLEAFPTYVAIAPDGRVSATEVGYDAGLLNDHLDGTAPALIQMVIDAASPEQLIAALAQRVAGAGLAKGTATSLTAHLAQARARLSDDNPANDVAAVGELRAFINQVAALAGKKIELDEAAKLIAAAEAVIGLLGD